MSIDLSTFDFEKLLSVVGERPDGKFNNVHVAAYLASIGMLDHLDAVLDVLTGLTKSAVFLSPDSFEPVRTFKIYVRPQHS